MIAGGVPTDPDGGSRRPADDPLVFLAAEHLRQRQHCQALRACLDKPFVPLAERRALSVFLRRDFVIQIDDCRHDLFPLLRLRAQPDDDVERVIGILSADDQGDLVLAAALADALDAPVAPANLADLVGRFTAQRLRHLALENAIVLPIARLRLTAADRQALAAAMSARRRTSIGP